MFAGTTHTISRMLQPADYRSNDERPKIETSESRTVLSPLRVGLKPSSNRVSSNIRHRSLSTSRLSKSDH